MLKRPLSVPILANSLLLEARATIVSSKEAVPIVTAGGSELGLVGSMTGNPHGAMASKAMPVRLGRRATSRHDSDLAAAPTLRDLQDSGERRSPTRLLERGRELGATPLRDMTYSGAVTKTRPEGPRVTQGGQPRVRLVLGHPPPDAKPQEALGGALRAVKLWQLTGGVRVVDAGPNGRFSGEDVDVDRHYGIKTRSRTIASANVAKTDLGIPIRIGDRLVFFFGDTWAYDVFRNPGPIIAGDPYGWTEARQDVFSDAPWIRFFTDSEPRGWAVGTGYAPLLRGVLPDASLGGARGPLGAFYDPATDTAYVFFVADVSEFRNIIRLDRTVVAAARNVSKAFVAVPPHERDVSMDPRYSSMAYPDGVERVGETWAPPTWEIVSHSTGPLLRAIAPVLVERSAVEPRATTTTRAGALGVERTAEIRYPETSRRDRTPEPPVSSARLDPDSSSPVVLLFGTDRWYRKSYVYLARCLLSDLDPGPRPPIDAFAQDLAALPSGKKLQYLQWVDYTKTPDGEPFWSEDPTRAMPLFTSTGPTVGQPHVVQEPKTGLWLMTHEGPEVGAEAEKGLRLRWAKNPWGPWGATTMVNPYTERVDAFEPVGGEPALILFSGVRDQAYGNYMHAKAPAMRLPAPAREVPHTLSIHAPNELNAGRFDINGDDGLSDDLLKAGPAADPQGAYGAYLIVPWFRYRRSALDSLLIDVVYTLATGNPFQVQLMSTTFEVHGSAIDRLDSGIETRPRRGW